MAFKLYDYQKKAINDTLASMMFDNPNNIAIDLPTGAGKSMVIAGLCAELADKSIVILVNITELIDQLAEHLDHFNLDYSIIKAGRDSEFNPDARIHIAMSQTMHKRLDKIDVQCDILIQDEIHKEYNTERTQSIMYKLKPDCRIGTSATCYDSSGFALADTENIESIAIPELERKGFLAPLNYYVPLWSERIDYSDVKQTAGEYNTVSLDLKINTDTFLDAAIVSMNEMNAKQKKTIVFCSSIEQCDNVVAKLKLDGFAAEGIHSKSGKRHNDTILSSFKHGTTYVASQLTKTKSDKSLFDDSVEPVLPVITCLVSVNKLAVGFNVKDIQLGVLLRSVRTRSYFIQMVGRTIRSSPGKQFGEILDCAQCVSTHGFHSEPYFPPKRTSDPEADKQTMAEIRNKRSMKFLKHILDDQSEPQLINLKDYQVQVKSMVAKEKAVRDKKADISTWSFADLGKLFDSTTSIEMVVTVGATIYTKKFGSPISKAGNSYEYDPTWITDGLQAKLDKYPELKSRALKSYRTRTRNIIKQGKNFNGIKYFIDWIIEKHIEDSTSIYDEFHKSKPNLPTMDMVIDDLSSIPF